MSGILCGQAYDSLYPFHARQDLLDQGSGTQLPGHRLDSLLWLSVSIPDVSHQGGQPIHQHLKAERYRKRTLGDIEIHGLSL